jgi:hypothetical protein
MRAIYTQGLFYHHGYISKPDICFLDNHGYQHDAQRGFGLISDTHPTLVTTYWKRQFAIPASPPSLGSIGPVTKWNWPGYQPGSTQSNIFNCCWVTLTAAPTTFKEGDCCCSRRMGSHRIPSAGLDG